MAWNCIGFHHPFCFHLGFSTVYQGLLQEHKEQEGEYGIPHGDWFEIVSSPHYLAEIVTPFPPSVSLNCRSFFS